MMAVPKVAERGGFGVPLNFGVEIIWGFLFVRGLIGG